MKKSLIIYLMFVASNIFGQDYIVKPDGTKVVGTITSMSKNSLQLKNRDGDVGEYKIDKLSVIHITDPGFEMKGVHLSNTKYEKNDNGIHIEMLDNPVVINTKPSSKSSTTSTHSETNSSLSITSEGNGPKAKVILKCDDCSNSGVLKMESEDKLAKATWEFECKKGSAFPMELEIDSNKTYNFKYKDGNRHSIEKKVTIKAGVNTIRVFE